MARAYFLSDIHLTGQDEPNARVLIAFLERLLEDARLGGDTAPTHLFLVGDIFDLWVGDHDYFKRKFGSVVGLVRLLAHSGVEVHYFEGNHDLHLEGFWSRDLGVKVHAGPAFFDIDGYKVRVEHGDQMNLEDTGYLFLRWLLRTEPVRKLALGLPEKVVSFIGEQASAMSRSYTSGAPEAQAQGSIGYEIVTAREKRIRDIIRSHAQRALKERPFDLLVSGHVHVIDDYDFTAGGTRVRAVNLGSWFDQPRVFAFTEGHGEFFSLT
jgi:UDP-2,3-diacylglucosamine hydrolase